MLSEEIEEIIRTLERERNTSIQIKIQSLDSKEEVYGSFKERTVQVIALPTDNEFVRHDIILLEGKYNNFKEINKEIDKLSLFKEGCAREMWANILTNLSEKYGIEEKEIEVANKPGEFVKIEYIKGMKDIILIPKSRLLKDAPLSYKIIEDFLKENKIPFLYNILEAKFDGIYLDNPPHLYIGLNRLGHLTDKVANIELSLL